MLTWLTILFFIVLVLKSKLWQILKGLDYFLERINFFLFSELFVFCLNSDRRQQRFNYASKNETIVQKRNVYLQLNSAKHAKNY